MDPNERRPVYMGTGKLIKGLSGTEPPAPEPESLDGRHRLAAAVLRHAEGKDTHITIVFMGDARFVEKLLPDAVRMSSPPQNHSAPSEPTLPNRASKPAALHKPAGV